MTTIRHTQLNQQAEAEREKKTTIFAEEENAEISKGKQYSASIFVSGFFSFRSTV